MPSPKPPDLICPENGKLMWPGFVESPAVLARRPAVYFAKSYERTVFVNPAKSAQV